MLKLDSAKNYLVMLRDVLHGPADETGLVRILTTMNDWVEYPELRAYLIENMRRQKDKWGTWGNIAFISRAATDYSLHVSAQYLLLYLLRWEACLPCVTTCELDVALKYPTPSELFCDPEYRRMAKGQFSTFYFKPTPQRPQRSHNISQLVYLTVSGSKIALRDVGGIEIALTGRVLAGIHKLVRPISCKELHEPSNDLSWLLP